MRIKLMADIGCHPLWDMDDPENVDPDTLALSEATRDALRAWADRYDATFNDDDPLTSGFASLADAEDHFREGLRLLERLRSELGSEVEVVYGDLPPLDQVSTAFDLIKRLACSPPLPDAGVDDPTGDIADPLFRMWSTWLDVLVCISCAVLPWLLSGWTRPAVGVGVFAMWFAVTRPTWSGLAPFYLTLLLLINFVALLLA